MTKLTVISDLFNTTWSALASGIRVQIHITNGIPSLIPVCLKVFNQTFTEGTQPLEASKSLTSETVRASIAQFEQILEADDSVAIDTVQLESLVAVLNTFAAEIFADDELASVSRFVLYTSTTLKLIIVQAIDDTCLRYAHRLVSISPAVLLVYLAFRGKEEECTSLWNAVLSEMATGPEDITKTLPPLLEAAEGNKLNNYLLPTDGNLDDTVGQLMVSALNGRSNENLSLVRRILTVPGNCVSSFVSMYAC